MRTLDPGDLNYRADYKNGTATSGNFDIIFGTFAAHFPDHPALYTGAMLCLVPVPIVC